MLAVLCRKLGSLDDLEVVDVASATAADGEVVVDVLACGLNFPDVLMVQGKYQNRPELPFTPGSELSGVVVDVGPGVTEFARGDLVCCNVGLGALQERLSVRASELVKIPERVDTNAAAGLLVTYCTSLYALRDRGGLRSGESLLVLGAGGGVGLAAVEIGVALGARVVAAASSDEKLDAARMAGAHELLRYSSDLRDSHLQKEFGARLKASAGAKGFDVIYDPVGGDYSEPALRSIAWQGRYLVVGFAAGRIPNIPLNLPLLKGCQIVGVIWGGSWNHDPAIKRRIGCELLGMLAAGELKPRIGTVLPLERAVEGLKMLAERRAVGKVIVEIGSKRPR
ncbi:MAG: NADPH:quinone oxidoreductase family protein [Steroidobacteraceae bacterium]